MLVNPEFDVDEIASGDLVRIENKILKRMLSMSLSYRSCDSDEYCILKLALSKLHESEGEGKVETPGLHCAVCNCPVGDRIKLPEPEISVDHECEWDGGRAVGWMEYDSEVKKLNQIKEQGNE